MFSSGQPPDNSLTVATLNSEILRIEKCQDAFLHPKTRDECCYCLM